jgi:pyridoxine 5-phosphate synthase
LESAETFSGVLSRYKQAVEHARKLGLAVNAGHDLNRQNLPTFASIPGIAEVSIGHALIADALELGMTAAVQAYLQCLTPTSRT